MTGKTLAEVFAAEEQAKEDRALTGLRAENALLKDRIRALEARFIDHALAMCVPVDVVVDAAAHTFDMLGVDEQVDLAEEALARWKAMAGTAKPEQSFQSGDTTIVLPNRQMKNQMRDDLLYRLMHERFDLVYAFAVKSADGKGEDDRSEWIFVTPRVGEEEAPPRRVTSLLRTLLVGLRKARQRFESVREAALRDGFGASR